MAYEAVSGNFNSMSTNAYKCPWVLNVKPFRVAPRVYYVGNEWVGAYLVDTEDGLILIDTTVFENVYLMLEQIRTLGFNPQNIKHIFLSHAHLDHDGGAQAIKMYTGAKIWLSKEDDEFRKKPQAFGKGYVIYPYEVDCFYDDCTPMQFGSVTITTKLTPGHTPGTTSFFITMPDENGNKLTAAMHGGVGTLTMDNKTLDGLGIPRSIRKTFIADCAEMRTMHVDIALPSHPAHGNLFDRVKPAKDMMDYSPMLNDTEWAVFLDSRVKFVEDLEQE